MPEVTSDATLIIATSWQALGRAETGDERAGICNCTVMIGFAAFFIEANLNQFIEKAAGKGAAGHPPGEEKIGNFRNDVAHGIINRPTATLDNAKRLRLRAKQIVDHLLEIAKKN